MTNIERIAERAYEEFARETKATKAWWELDGDEKETWCEIVRIVVREAASMRAMQVLEEE